AWLLRACRERPSRETAEKSDELAPPHGGLPQGPRPRSRIDYSRSGPCIAAKAGRLFPLWVIFVRSARSRRSQHVRFAPKADKRTLASICPLSAKSGLTHRSKERFRAKLSRDSVQSHARIKAELALCLLRGEVSARLGDIVDTATRLLDRQH